MSRTNGPRRGDQPVKASQDNGRTYWNRYAKNYDRSMLVFGRPLAEMAELAANAVKGARRVLEVGAGTGLVTMALAAAVQHVVATDYAERMLTVLQRRIRDAGVVNVTLQRADLSALPFEAHSFDAVVCANVLHLLPDLELALAAVRKVLKPGASFVAPTYCHGDTRLARAVSRVLAVTGFPVQQRFTFDGLRHSLEAGGLQVTRCVLLPGVIPIGYIEGVFGAVSQLSPVA